MAAWQADYEVVLSGEGLPADYRQRLAALLPSGKSWTEQLEVWGAEDGDRVDVFTPQQAPPEILARFDLRECKPQLYERFLGFVRDVQGKLRLAEDQSDVSLSLEASRESLRRSGAAQFVGDPWGYLRSLKGGVPPEVKEQP